MTTAERKQTADAERRRERAEAREMDARIRLAITRERLTAVVAAENKRRKCEAQGAAKKLAQDAAGQLMLAEQFLSDPALVSLALTKRIHRAGTS